MTTRGCHASFLQTLQAPPPECKCKGCGSLMPSATILRADYILPQKTQMQHCVYLLKYVNVRAEVYLQERISVCTHACGEMLNPSIYHSPSATFPLKILSPPNLIFGLGNHMGEEQASKFFYSTPTP